MTLPIKSKLKNYLHIITYFDIAKYTNITEQILKSVELSKKDKILDFFAFSIKISVF